MASAIPFKTIGLLLFAAIIGYITGSFSGTHEAFAEERTASIQQVYICMKQDADAGYLGLERLHQGTIFCFSHLDDKQLVPKAWDEFYVCSFQMADPITDLPPNVTTDDYRKAMQHCLSLAPSK